jgi:hypothetical protein
VECSAKLLLLLQFSGMFCKAAVAVAAALCFILRNMHKPFSYFGPTFQF